MTELQERTDNFIKSSGKTVRQFCRLADVSHQTYYDWMNGVAQPHDRTLDKIETFLTSKQAKDILDENAGYLSVSDCARITGLKTDVICRLCKDGVIDAKESSGRHWRANIEDLQKYIRVKRPNRIVFESTPNDQRLAFGSLEFNFDTYWKPLLSAHNDTEIFDLERHEYNNQYWVSNRGTVFNATTCNVIKPESDGEGYINIHLSKGDEDATPYLHRVVAYLFCTNNRCKDFVHHINGDKRDNRACNLLWVTAEEHKECHRLMKKNKKAYRSYVNKIKKENSGKRA